MPATSQTKRREGRVSKLGQSEVVAVVVVVGGGGVWGRGGGWGGGGSEG